MIRALFMHMAEGIFAPRRSVRFILLLRPSAETSILLAVLAYLIQAMLQIVLPVARNLPEEVTSLPLTLHLLNIAVQLLIVAILAALVFAIGRVFGGEGSRRQALAVVAWHTLVTTLLAPVFILGMADVTAGEDPSPGATVMLACAGSVWLWILSVFTAELHGFRSPWGVMAGMLGAIVVFSTVFASLIQAS